MANTPQKPASDSEFSEQLREMNEQLIRSSVRQQELTEAADAKTEALRVSERAARDANAELTERGSELEKLNAELRDSRLEAVNLMDEAVHARQKAEQASAALRESEVRYRRLFETIDEGFCIIEFFDGPHGPLSDYVHIEANPAYTVNAGIPDIVGQKVREMVPAEAEGWVEIYRNVLITGKPVRFERELVATGRHLELAAYRVEPPERRQVAVLFKDITARKHAEDALRESETRHRLALEAGGMGTWTMPMDGRRAWADQRTLALFDILPEEWKGDIATIHSRRFPEDIEANSQYLADAEGRRTWMSEFRVRHRDDSIRWIAGVARIEFGPEGVPLQMRGIYFDITARKRAEEELRRHHELLEETVHERTRDLAAAISELEYENRQRRIVEEERQMLLARLVAAQEEERRRIAQDLHDQLGQQLTALNMKLDLAARAAASGDGKEHLSEARAMLRRIDDDVDALAWQLRPAILDDDGFVPALRRYVEDWSERCCVPADFWADDLFESSGFLSAEAETNIYRITQEALNNIAKYADASRVEVLLKSRGDSVVLLIQDDGTGFDVDEPNDANVKTMGLIGMRERAGLVDGTFEIESSIGRGTTIYVQVPIASESADGVERMQTARS